MIFNKNFLIGQELVRRKLINQEQLDKGLIYHEEKGIRLGRALIELGFIVEDDLIDVIADQLSIKHVHVIEIEINQDVLNKVNKNIALRFNILPVSYISDILTICVSDPLNTELIHKLQDIFGKNIKLCIASKNEINEAINKHYN